jgi:hypothetical protein
MKLYVIDLNSRQYPFDINEGGIKLVVDGNEQVINIENINLDVFYDIINNKKTFTLKSNDGIGIVFNCQKLIGVQLYNGV